MKCFVLMVMPHLNVRASLRALKRGARDFAADDAVMALPEGIVLEWFDVPEGDVSARLQLALARSHANIGAALPDSFSFRAAEKWGGRWFLKLDNAPDSTRLSTALRSFASEAALDIRDPPALYVSEALGAIALGSADEISVPTPVSFKKYELVIYLAELPATPLSGFQFSAIARVHRKSANGQRRSHIA